MKTEVNSQIQKQIEAKKRSAVHLLLDDLYGTPEDREELKTCKDFMLKYRDPAKIKFRTGEGPRNHFTAWYMLVRLQEFDPRVSRNDIRLEASQFTKSLAKVKETYLNPDEEWGMNVERVLANYQRQFEFQESHALGYMLKHSGAFEQTIRQIGYLLVPPRFQFISMMGQLERRVVVTGPPGGIMRDVATFIAENRFAQDHKEQNLIPIQLATDSDETLDAIKKHPQGTFWTSDKEVIDMLEQRVGSLFDRIDTPTFADFREHAPEKEFPNYLSKFLSYRWGRDLSKVTGVDLYAELDAFASDPQWKAYSFPHNYTELERVLSRWFLSPKKNRPKPPNSGALTSTETSFSFPPGQEAQKTLNQVRAYLYQSTEERLTKVYKSTGDPDDKPNLTKVGAALEITRQTANQWKRLAMRSPE